MLVAWSQLGGAFTYHIRVIEANASPKPEHLSKKQDGGETEGQILHFGTSESDLASGATSSSGTSSLSSVSSPSRLGLTSSRPITPPFPCSLPSAPLPPGSS